MGPGVGGLGIGGAGSAVAMDGVLRERDFGKLSSLAAEVREQERERESSNNGRGTGGSWAPEEREKREARWVVGWVSGLQVRPTHAAFAKPNNIPYFYH